jgi:hypothetical protein
MSYEITSLPFDSELSDHHSHVRAREEQTQELLAVMC